MDKKIIAAASFGTLFEMYDYAIYGFMAPILAPLFFLPLINTLLSSQHLVFLPQVFLFGHSLLIG